MTRASVLAMILVTGCSAGGVDQNVTVRDSAGVRIVENHAPLWTEGEGWKLAEQPRLVIEAAGVGDGRLLDPGTVHRATDGRWIVGDGRYRGADAVLVFDEQGHFIEQLGRAGEGPCEFGQLWWAAPYRGDSIAVHDYSRHTMAIFSADGECGREVRLPTWDPPQTPGTWGFADAAHGVFDDGSFLASPAGYLDTATGAGPVWYRQSYMRVAPEGEAWDSLGLFPIRQNYWTGTSQEDLPFAPTHEVAMTGDGFVTTTGESFELRRWAADRTLREIVRRAWDAAPVGPVERERFVDWYAGIVASAEGGPEAAAQIRRQLTEGHWPDHKPAISAVVVDAEGNVWAEEYRWVTPDFVPADPPPTYWSVFAPDGRWLGRVTVPGRFLPREIGADYVTGFHVDEYDAKHVHMYDLEKR